MTEAGRGLHLACTALRWGTLHILLGKAVYRQPKDLKLLAPVNLLMPVESRKRSRFVNLAQLICFLYEKPFCRPNNMKGLHGRRLSHLLFRRIVSTRLEREVDTTGRHHMSGSTLDDSLLERYG